MNTDELDYATMVAERRVLEIQAKLHRWATGDAHRRFDDLFNLVADPAFLLVAWDRVRGNRGARTAGVDGRTAASIAVWTGVEEFLGALRASLRDRSFRPLPVRERMIPKANGRLRRLGIATVDSCCPSCSRVSGCEVLARECPGQDRMGGSCEASMAGGTGVVITGAVPGVSG